MLALATGVLLACSLPTVNPRAGFGRGPIGPFGDGPVLSVAVSPSGRVFAGTVNNGVSWSSDGAVPGPPQLGISNATYYRWRKEYGGLRVD